MHCGLRCTSASLGDDGVCLLSDTVSHLCLLVCFILLWSWLSSTKFG